MIDKELQQKEVDINYKEFLKQLPELKKTQAGKYTLMREGKVIDFFDTPRDAYVAGKNMFSDDMVFSIQEVIETPVDLGFFSHALPQR